MKKYRLCLALAVCLLVSACGNLQKDAPPDLSEPPQTAAPGQSELMEIREPPPEEPAEGQTLEQAAAAAIFSENAGKYLPGECQGVGCRIFEVFSREEQVWVYALAEYIEYGFQDGALVNLSGTRARVLMIFRRESGPEYTLESYTPLDSMSGLSDEELAALLAPLAETGKDYTYSDADLRELRAQADAWAEDYLRSIGREAAVGERASHKENALYALGVSEDVWLSLAKNELTDRYPEWTGTCESLEDGERYVYRTDYDAGSRTIQYTKTRYETGETAERMTFDGATGERLP